MTAEGIELLIEKRAALLAADLQAVSLHRDAIDAERARLAARILRLMVPGQYLEHAVAAGYDVTKDPLMLLKREELEVEHRYHLWQGANAKPRRARRLDPEQTLDEQAYAAAQTARWKRINHPPLGGKHPASWLLIGVLTNSKTEPALRADTRTRVDRMRRNMGEIC